MKQKKIIIGLVITLFFIGLVGGTYILARKYFVKPVADFVNSGQNGLPGRLLGPITSQKAKNLDPMIVLKWTNQYRADNDLIALKENDLLAQAAQKKTADMFLKQYFEHISPDGVKPSQLVASVGYGYKVTGENLALGDFKDEKDLVDAWMASPGHRANILNKDYTEIGIATDLDTFEDRGKTWLAVQEFGKPVANCAKPNTNILDSISSKKSTYDSLNNQITTLSAEASNLNNQANDKIQQGNEIYRQTGDKTQAQPYWDEGTALRTKAETNITQVKILQTQAETLNTEIQKESDTYNALVNTYNICIAN